LHDAFLNVIRQVLTLIGETGSPYHNGVLISFRTSHPGTRLPASLRRQYPKEMKLTLQYQFDELVVGEDDFSVILYFGGVPKKLTIPFQAIMTFEDLGQSVTFTMETEADVEIDSQPTPDDTDTDEDSGIDAPADVIRLDMFRDR